LISLFDRNTLGGSFDNDSRIGVHCAASLSASYSFIASGQCRAAADPAG
jgi:hypothetical protein